MPRVRVLLVDDSPACRKVTARLLTSDPRIELVGLAASGAEALERVAALKPDIVLMDWVMPRMDGLEATRRIKAQSDAPLVLMLSCHDNDEYQNAAAAHADGFLPKAKCAALLLPTILQLVPLRYPLSA
jgi:CheY-like chemotaxis protein